MRTTTKRDRVRALLARHGRTYAEDLGIDLTKRQTAPLFRLLCAAVLFSAPIRAATAVRAARGLAERGWTSARALAASTTRQRVRVLARHGYARYDGRAADRLGGVAQLLLRRYRGDLSALRATAARQPARERQLLKELPGIGDVAVDIFFREAQVAWPELRPFVDRRALAAARRLGLGTTPAALAALVPPAAFARLVAALVRVDLADDYRNVRTA